MKRMTAWLVGASLTLTGCGGGGGGSISTPAPVPTGTPTPTPTGGGTASCTAGSWTIPPSTIQPAVQYESPHFAFRWIGSPVTTAQAKQAADMLEAAFTAYVGFGMPEPFCGSATKAKINVLVDDGVFTETGGADVQGLPLIKSNSATLSDRATLAHELVHVFQWFSNHLAATPYTAAFWETHAVWLSSQLPELRGNSGCEAGTADLSYMAMGSARLRYCNTLFLEYLKNQYGYPAVQNIWRTAPRVGEAGQATADPYSVLMANMGWSLSRLNDEVAIWASRNITFDYTNPDGTDQGAVWRTRSGPYTNTYTLDGHPRRLAEMTAIDLANRRFAVPAVWAPQRWGYNVVQLFPDAGATSVSVAFRGVTQAAAAATSFPGFANEPSPIPAPASGWRWSVVVVDAAGKPRYSTLMRGGDEQLSVPLQAGDKGVYLLVVGAPGEMQKIVFNQPYYSMYRFPYMIQLTGALPNGYQPGAPTPTAAGHAHPNGGGWVADGAVVDASAYVGPQARVIGGQVRGNARLEGNAILFGGTLSGNAVLAGLSMFADGTVTDTARIETWYAPVGGAAPVNLSGTAQLRGDFAQTDAGYGPQPFTAAKGVYFGPTMTGDANVPSKGANLTSAPAEVTATPNYVWR